MTGTITLSRADVQRVLDALKPYEHGDSQSIKGIRRKEAFNLVESALKEPSSGQTVKESLTLAEPVARTAWLVESTLSAMWWDGRFVSRGIDPRHFTTDPNLAVRFSRKEDAERIANQSSAMKATEHMWIGDTAPQGVNAKLLEACQGVAAMSRCGQLDPFIGEPWLNAVFAAIKQAEGAA